MSSTPVELHVWPGPPGQWGLPSVDAASLSLIIYLQLVLPSQFVLVETTNPELSPSGQLPFLKNGEDVVAPFSSIISYLANNGSNDAQGPKSHAPWLAHAESNLGDLVLHMFYSLHANWNELTFPSIAHHFPVLQRYYRPNAIRQSYKSRLETAGLWSLPGIEIEQEKKAFSRKPQDFDRLSEQQSTEAKEGVKAHDRFLQVFEREKVLDKARSTLDIYARLLGQKDFFSGDRPSLLDATVAAHILLLSRPPFPDPLLQDLVNNSYPSLVAHANRVYDLTLSAPLSTIDATTESDVWETRLRFAFFGLALGGIITYSAASHLNVITP